MNIVKFVFCLLLSMLLTPLLPAAANAGPQSGLQKRSSSSAPMWSSNVAPVIPGPASFNKNPWLLPAQPATAGAGNRSLFSAKYYDSAKHSFEGLRKDLYASDFSESVAVKFVPRQYRNKKYVDFEHDSGESRSESMPLYREKIFQNDRFVTPEILESLARQQVYYQQSPRVEASENTQEFKNRRPRLPVGDVSRWPATAVTPLPAMPIQNLQAYRRVTNYLPYSYPPNKGGVSGYSADEYGLNQINPFDRFSGGNSLWSNMVDDPGRYLQYDAASPWESLPQASLAGERYSDRLSNSFADVFDGSIPYNMPQSSNEINEGFVPYQLELYEPQQYMADNVDSGQNTYNPGYPDGYIRQDVFKPRSFMPIGGFQ